MPLSFSTAFKCQLIPEAEMVMLQAAMAHAQLNGEGFVNIRPCLNQIVEVMELLYGETIRRPSKKPIGPWPENDDQRVGKDLANLEYSPQKAVLVDQARIIWQQVIRRNIQAVWFIRTHQPDFFFYVRPKPNAFHQTILTYA